MRLHVEALFAHDARGRLLRVNEPDGGPPPRLFLGRTAAGNVWRLGHDVDDALARELDALCRDEPRLAGDADDDEVPPPRHVARYEALLARAAPIARRWAGPAYRFPPALPAEGDVVLLTAATADLLR